MHTETERCRSSLAADDGADAYCTHLRTFSPDSPHMRLTPALAVLSALLAASVLPASLHAQAAPADTGALPARLAWERGDYPEALRGFSTLLEAPGGDRYLEEIALITGELYRTTELTRDGRNIRVSPSGKLASYESGTGGRAETRRARSRCG